MKLDLYAYTNAKGNERKASSSIAGVLLSAPAAISDAEFGKAFTEGQFKDTGIVLDNGDKLLTYGDSKSTSIEVADTKKLSVIGATERHTLKIEFVKE